MCPRLIANGCNAPPALGVLEKAGVGVDIPEHSSISVHLPPVMGQDFSRLAGEIPGESFSITDCSRRPL